MGTFVTAGTSISLQRSCVQTRGPQSVRDLASPPSMSLGPCNKVPILCQKCHCGAGLWTSPRRRGASPAAAPALRALALRVVFAASAQKRRVSVQPDASSNVSLLEIQSPEAPKGLGKKVEKRRGFVVGGQGNVSKAESISWEELMAQIDKDNGQLSEDDSTPGGEQDKERNLEDQRRRAEQVWRIFTLLGVPEDQLKSMFPPGCALLQATRKENQLRAKLELLRSYGFNTAQLASLAKSRPSALGRSSHVLSQVLETLLDFGVSRDKLPKVAISGSLDHEVEGNLLPKIMLLNGLGLGPTAATLVEKAPTMLTTSLSRLQETSSFLKATLTSDEFAQTIVKNPKLLTYPPDGLDLLIRNLRTLCTIQAEELQVTLARLDLFTWDLVQETEAKMEVLATAVGEENVKSIIMREPHILGAQLTTLQATVAELESILQQEQIRDVVLREPTVVTYDWSTRLKPLLDFALEACDISIVDALLSQAWSRPLDKVVKPRVTYLLNRGFILKGVGDGAKLTRTSTKNGIMTLSNVSRMSLGRFKKAFPDYLGY